MLRKRALSLFVHSSVLFLALFNGAEASVGDDASARGWPLRIKGCRTVVGDTNQLASVDAGEVFHEEYLLVTAASAALTASRALLVLAAAVTLCCTAFSALAQ